MTETSTMTMTRMVARARQWPVEVRRAYSGGHDRPLGGYVCMLAIYASGTLGTITVAKLRGARLPVRLAGFDVVLAGIATQKLSRMIAKDPVLSPFRAPFTKFAGVSGESELAEEVRGTGVQHAAGELISCPFCLSQWVATALVAGLVIAPRATRAVIATVTMKAVSDATQLAYDALQKATQAMPS